MKLQSAILRALVVSCVGLGIPERGFAAEAQAAAATSPAASVPEQAASPFSAYAIVGATSDYVYRGVSLSGERPTGMAIVEAAYGVAYFSGVLVGTELGEDALGRSIGNLEADATVGIRPTFGNVELNLGVKYTGYPNGRDIVFDTLDHAERDFIEFFAGGKVNLNETFSIGATSYWTPNFYYETGEVTTLELQAAMVLPAVMNMQSRLTSSVGHVRSEARDIVSPGHGYTYYNAGIEGQLDRFVFDVRYWGTDVSRIDEFDRRIVVSLGMKLP